MTTYYKSDQGYIGVTDQSPHGLRGLVFLGRGPDKDGKVVEQGYAIHQLDKMERVKPEDVPDEWFKAIGYDKRAVVIPIKSLPEGTHFLFLEKLAAAMIAGYILLLWAIHK